MKHVRVVSFLSLSHTHYLYLSPFPLPRSPFLFHSLSLSFQQIAWENFFAESRKRVSVQWKREKEGKSYSPSGRKVIYFCLPFIGPEMGVHISEIKSLGVKRNNFRQQNKRKKITRLYVFHTMKVRWYNTIVTTFFLEIVLT